MESLDTRQPSVDLHGESRTDRNKNRGARARPGYSAKSRLAEDITRDDSSPLRRYIRVHLTCSGWTIRMDFVHRRNAFGVRHLCALAPGQLCAVRDTEFDTEFIAKVQNSAKKV